MTSETCGLRPAGCGLRAARVSRFGVSLASTRVRVWSIVVQIKFYLHQLRKQRTYDVFSVYDSVTTHSS